MTDLLIADIKSITESNTEKMNLQKSTIISTELELWKLCKVRLAKFKRVPKHNFYLHIKEYEFRVCLNFAR